MYLELSCALMHHYNLQSVLAQNLQVTDILKFNTRNKHNSIVVKYKNGLLEQEYFTTQLWLIGEVMLNKVCKEIW